MEIEIMAFGIARDILKSSNFKMTLKEKVTIEQLKSELCQRFPEFEKLKHFDLAVNQEYQENDFTINNGDEIAIIPPVSGG